MGRDCMIIGICGKSGSGKSTLANQIMELTDNKAVHLDIDKIGHKVLLIPEVKEELIQSFGEKIIVQDKVNRKKLGEVVFNSRHEMEKLTDITWKYMQVEIDQFLDDNKEKNVILDWLLLSITKYFAICDLKILLDIPFDVRKQRAMKRDNISDVDFLLREKSSIDFNAELFDCILHDNNDIESVLKVVELL